MIGQHMCDMYFLFFECRLCDNLPTLAVAKSILNGSDENISRAQWPRSQLIESRAVVAGGLA